MCNIIIDGLQFYSLFSIEYLLKRFLIHLCLFVLYVYELEYEPSNNFTSH